MKYTAYIIPHNDDLPVLQVELDEDADLTELVFGEAKDGPLGCSTLARHGIQFMYDDLGIYSQPGNVNARAMQLWATVAGMQVTDFVQNLVGNYVVLGLDASSGETTDVPHKIADKISTEWMGK